MARVGSPVERVVKLLEDLRDTLYQDEKMEKLSYDKFACWCTKTTARKATDITEGQALLREVKTRILEEKGDVASTLATIKKLKADINDTIESQISAQNIRATQHDNYVAESTEMMEVLATLEKARIVLRKATTPALLQSKAASVEAVKAVLKVLPSRSVVASVQPDRLALLTSFTAAGSKSEKYAPQSWTVQGILADMYKGFSVDLEEATQAEAQASRDFEQLYYDLEQQKLAYEESLAKEEAHLASVQEKLAADLQLYDDTDVQLKDNIAFFDTTNATCTAKNEEWTLRSTARSSEIAGIRQALTILTTDEARALFGKTIKPWKETNKLQDTFGAGGLVGAPSPSVALIQLASSSAPRERAYQALREQATKTKSLRLASL